MTVYKGLGLATLTFGTENQTFSNLIVRPATFKVPPFQRDYSWSEDNWDDFWQDTVQITSDDKSESHYMGYLVLQSSDNKIYSIIDGQQRLTTISIFILSGLAYLDMLINNNIDPENNTKRKSELSMRYIGFTDPITLEQKSKIELNRHNNNFYQTYLVPLLKLPQRGLNSSEHKMRKAFNWFFDKLKEHLETSEDGGQKLARFISNLLDKIFFTVITVTDELNAYKVFETLNARGVKLSSADLLKNLIFSTIVENHIHESQFKHLEDMWENIVNNLSNESLPEFLRCFWNSKNKLVRKNDLFKVIKNSIESKDNAMQLLKDMLTYSEFYSALRDPNDQRWDCEEKEAIEQLSMFSVKQPLAMLLSSYASFFDSNRRTFSRILKSIAAISFRYNVICNKKTYEQERVYSDVAIRINSRDLDSLDKIKESLKEIYPGDNEFIGAFSVKTLKTTSSRNKKIARYILFKIESSRSAEYYDFNCDKYNIEHILPENPDNNWSQFSDKEKVDYLYKIGNMAIIKQKDNNRIGNSSFISKKEVYKTSEFQTTKAIEDRYSDWNPKNIDARQEYLAKAACQIWKLA